MRGICDEYSRLFWIPMKVLRKEWKFDWEYDRYIKYNNLLIYLVSKISQDGIEEFALELS